MKNLPLVECCTPLAGSSLSDDEAAELERLFKALADRHRLRIINILLRSGDQAVCVCEFQPALDVSQPTVSHHLKQLLEAGLLVREKRGSFAYFRLAPGALERISALLAESPVLARRLAARARPALARSLGAELIGTFALVFAGCGAIMVDAETQRSATSGSRSRSGW